MGGGGEGPSWKHHFQRAGCGGAGQLARGPGCRSEQAEGTRKSERTEVSRGRTMGLRWPHYMRTRPASRLPASGLIAGQAGPHWRTGEGSFEEERKSKKPHKKGGAEGGGVGNKLERATRPEYFQQSRDP